MKKYLLLIIFIILLFYILCFPVHATKAASFGLILWYTKILPTLLPLSILSNILIGSGFIQICTKHIPSFLYRPLGLSNVGLYPVIAGFLFGFPLGSIIIVKLIEEGTLSFQEGKRLYVVCNNLSPVFICNFVLTETLNRPDLIIISLLCLYLPPILYLLFSSIGYTSQHVKNAAPRSQINFKIIDAGIMNSFETLTKLGGYIVLFSIISQMVQKIPFPIPIAIYTLNGIVEVTNGISSLCAASYSFEVKYVLAIFITAFGGLSGIAQTASTIKSVNLSIKSYIFTKVLCSATSVILALLFVVFL